jgi:hypothetical protein
MTREKPSLDIKKAVTIFVYVERIKSELIIASRLLEEIQDLKGNESEGAKKLILSFLNALQGETQMAYNVSGEENFEQATRKVWEATERTRSNGYWEAIRCISEAISITTTIGQPALQLLKEKGLL